MRSALICGVSSDRLTESERDFFADVRPAGLILFARNCQTQEQIKALVAETRTAVGDDNFLVLIDQEGGRVQRLRPPLGRALPPAASYGVGYQEEPEKALRAAKAVAHLLARDLRALGIDTNCAPVLDLPVPGAHDIIGDRAYSTAIAQVVALAGAVADGFLAGGVVPVIKHIPGHGRATADSHLSLPVVDTPHQALSNTDFAPFQALHHLPAAMTAHVVFSDIDDRAPASVSKVVIDKIIRNEIGFDGLLMSDDLSMNALSGTMEERARSVIAAGSDVALHCNGVFSEMADAAATVPALSGQALARFETACALTQRQDPLELEAAEALLTWVLSCSDSAC